MHIRLLLFFVILTVSAMSAADLVVERYPVARKDSFVTDLWESPDKGYDLDWAMRPLFMRWPRYPYLSAPSPVRLDPKTKYKFTFERSNLAESDSGLELLKIEKGDELIFDGWICEVHRTKMELKDVKVVYGFIGFIPPHDLSHDEMVRMKMFKFPHFEEIVLGGCNGGGVARAPKLICAECKKAYSSWASLGKAEAIKQIPRLGAPFPYRPAQ